MGEDDRGVRRDQATEQSNHLNIKTTDGDFVSAFRQLFHIANGVQQREGKYPGARLHVNDDQLCRHLLGEVAYAFCTTTKLHSERGKAFARFTAFDVDRHFPQRLPVLREVLTELKVHQAVCVTPGSSADKGKIIVTFDKFVPRYQASDLGMLILQAGHEKMPELIPKKPVQGDLELYPKSPDADKDGGVLRICGRNIARNGPVETLRDLQNEPLDLAKLRPLRPGQVQHRSRKYVRSNTPTDPSWVRELVSTSWTWATFPRAEQRKKFTALAIYCNGDVARYISYLQQMRTRSPGLSEPSPGTGDDRNPISREIKELGAWRNAQTLNTWRPMQTDDPVYLAMLRHIRTRGLREYCFGLTSRELARLMQCAQSTAQKRLWDAEAKGIAVCLDPGTANSGSRDANGKWDIENGTCGLWALPGERETVYDVLGKAFVDRDYIARAKRSRAISTLAFNIVFDTVMAEVTRDEVPDQLELVA